MTRSKILSIAFAIAAISAGVYISKNKDESRAKTLELDKAMKFESWFRSHGGEMHPLVQLTFNQLYGFDLAIPFGEIEEGDKLLEIPNKLIFSRSKAQNIMGENGEDISLLSSISDDALLTSALMIEYCGSSLERPSFFTPYLDVLVGGASRYKEIPVLTSFLPDELEMLDDSSLIDLATNEKSRRQTEWGVIKHWSKSTATTNDCFTEQLFDLMYAAITSHRVMDASGTISLIPMADMINHLPRSSNKNPFEEYHQRREDSFVVLADRDLTDSVLEEYNKLDNSIFLLHFGFCPVENPYHCVMLTLNGQDLCVDKRGRPFALEELHEDTFEQILPDLASIRDAANSALKAKSTDLHHDYILQQEMGKKLLEGTLRHQMYLAISCRIEDKKLLHHIASLPL